MKVQFGLLILSVFIGGSALACNLPPYQESLAMIDATLVSHRSVANHMDSVKSITLLGNRVVVETLDARGNCHADGYTIQSTRECAYHATPDSAVRNCK